MSGLDLENVLLPEDLDFDQEFEATLKITK